jgi:crotonobetainyl-CoA:carnitine CoA-transferase CaiB-like acyl-CoA transferase
VLGPRGAGHPSLCPFDIYETSDGAVAIAAPIENHWAKLCFAMGRPELVDDERTRNNPQRAAHRDFVTEVITAWTRSRTKQDVIDVLGGEVPVGPVNTACDIFDDPHVAARRMLAEVEVPGDNDRLLVAGTPIKFTATPAGVYRRAPLLGEHTDEVLAELPIRSPGPKEKP